MREYHFFVYILSSKSGVLYVGMTSNLEGRMSEHKQGLFKNSFTKKYNVKKLVYFEHYDYVYDAMKREVQLKKWTRKKKQMLIEKTNPEYKDLCALWGQW